MSNQWTLDELQHLASFGELGVDITHKLNLTLGIRWREREYKTTTFNPSPESGEFLLTPPEFGGGHGPGSIYTGTVRDMQELPDFGTDFTPKVSLSYHFNDDVMLCESHAAGFTQGDISVSTFNNFFVQPKPEIVSTVEVGLRPDWLDGSLRLNANIFASEWDGLRVPILPVDPVTGQQLPFHYNTDEGKAEASGLEVELIWAATDGIKSNASIGQLDTKYLEVGDPVSSPLRVGATFQYAPENAASVGVQYDRMLASGAGPTFRGDCGWMDEYQRDAAAQRQPMNSDGSDKSEPAYGVLNLRLRDTSPDGAWSASVFGTNLTDERYINGGFDARNPFGLDFVTVGRAREHGASLQFNFD